MTNRNALVEIIRRTIVDRRQLSSAREIAEGIVAELGLDDEY